MRSILLLALSLVVPTAQALSLGPLLPRVQLSSMFEVERNSAGGNGGAHAADGKLGGLPSHAPLEPEDTIETTAPVEPGTAPEPHRGGPMDPPKLRWKSMMPGALK